MENYLIIIKKLRKILKKYNYHIIKCKVGNKKYYTLFFLLNNDLIHIANWNTDYSMISGNSNIFKRLCIHTESDELMLLMKLFRDCSMEEIILKLQLMGY